MDVDGIYNLALIWHCGAGSGTICPTFHVHGTCDDLIAFNAAFASFAQELAETVAPAVRSDAWSAEYRTRRLSGGGPEPVEGEYNYTTGAAPPSTVPLYCSVLVNKQTDAGFEGHRGRMYLPFPGDVFLDGDLVENTNAGLVAGAAVASHGGSWGGITFDPVIYHAAGGTWHAVTGHRIANYATHRKWRAVNHFRSTL